MNVFLNKKELMLILAMIITYSQSKATMKVTSIGELPQDLTNNDLACTVKKLLNDIENVKLQIAKDVVTNKIQIFNLIPLL